MSTLEVGMVKEMYCVSFVVISSWMAILLVSLRWIRVYGWWGGAVRRISSRVVGPCLSVL